MGNNQNTLELNGNTYDARTGKILAGQPSVSAKVQPPKTGNGSVDGFARRSSQTVRQTAKVHSGKVHAKLSKSKTLMRSAVKKPAKPAPAGLREQVIDEQKSLGVDRQRLERAQSFKTSNLVSRFGGQPPAVDKKVAHLPVRQMPISRQASSISLPIQEPNHRREEQDLPLSTLDLALKNANGHEQPEIKKQSLRQRAAKRLKINPRTLNVGAGLLVALVIGGFLAYQHIPNLAVQLAAARAGVSAKLPGYKPSGFALDGPVQYGAGQLTLQYNSNSDDRSFKVIQKSSDWNSQALLENFVAASGNTYQTFQDNGKTIYIYEGSNATWVSGGTWYQIEGESSLNSDQLLRIAASL